MANVLFITHNAPQCGVFQYGVNLITTLKHSQEHTFVHKACNDVNDFNSIIKNNFDVIIYNFIPEVMPWVFNVTGNLSDRIKQLAIIHEPAQRAPSHMSGLISQDPSITNMYSPGRVVLDYTNNYPTPTVPTFGSFGFGFSGKGFDKLVKLVQEEYDEAIIRLHIPYSYYGDNDGSKAKETAKICRSLIYKPHVKLEIDHDFFDIPDLIDWLAQNSVNAFLYDYFPNRGISGPPDYALAARRPLALTKSYMFKHMWLGATKSIFIEDTTLADILNNGVEVLQHFYNCWSEKTIVSNYNNIINDVIYK